MTSTLLPPNCVQKVFKSPEMQIPIYKSVQLLRSLKPQVAPSGLLKGSRSFHWEAFLKKQAGQLSSPIGLNFHKSIPKTNNESETKAK